jgi:hypothetical protein
VKKISFIVILIAMLGCNQRKANIYELPGSFKYLSFHWNNAKDSVGLKLVHYLSIDKDGSYELILRVKPDSAAYYYGIIDTANIAMLRNFIADTSFKNNYLKSATDTNRIVYDGPYYMVDYKSDSAKKKITFIPQYSPDAIKIVQVKLDSIINRPVMDPWKIGHSPFDINSYLKSIIREDSAQHLFSTSGVSGVK